MAAGLTNTLRQVGTATGVAVFGALYASRVTAATVHELADLPTAPVAVHRLAGAVASGGGTRVAAVVPIAARAAVIHAARAGTARGLNVVLLAAATFAGLGAIVGFAFGPDPRPPSPVPAAGELSAPTPPLRQDALEGSSRVGGVPLAGTQEAGPTRSSPWSATARSFWRRSVLRRWASSARSWFAIIDDLSPYSERREAENG